jgi:hypothetical protein
MALPERIQEKIQNYTNILTDRYPPSITFYRISIGYSKSTEAQADVNPSSIIYTTGDLTPTPGVIVYTDQSKKITFNGSNLWYNVFNSSSTRIGRVIRIDTSGNITNEIIF